MLKVALLFNAQYVISASKILSINTKQNTVAAEPDLLEE